MCETKRTITWISFDVIIMITQCVRKRNIFLYKCLRKVFGALLAVCMRSPSNPSAHQGLRWKMPNIIITFWTSIISIYVIAIANALAQTKPHRHRDVGWRPRDLVMIAHTHHSEHCSNSLCFWYCIPPTGVLLKRPQHLFWRWNVTLLQMHYRIWYCQWRSSF